MTSKLVVNSIEADTGISSVSFASSISLSSSSVFHLGDAGINIGADTNISRIGNGVLGFNINGTEKARIDTNGNLTATLFTGSGANLTNLPSNSAVTNDISVLALKVSALENSTASNTNSTFVDTYQDSAGISTITNASVDSGGGEYVSSTVITYGTDQFWGGGDLDVNSVVNHGMGPFSAADLVDGSAVHSGLQPNRINGPSNFSTGVGYDIGGDSDFGNLTRLTGFQFYNHNWYGRFKDFRIEIAEDGSNYTKIPNITSATARTSDLSDTVVRADNVANGYAGFTIDTFHLCSASTKFRVMFDGAHNNSNNDCNMTQIQVKAQKATQTINAAGSYQSVTINAAATTSKMGVVITYTDTSGTATLNTDLKVFLSADNGSNYTQATLVAQANFATGIKMAKATDETISNTGTQLKYKVEFANQSSGSKETRVNGVSHQY